MGDDGKEHGNYDLAFRVLLVVVGKGGVDKKHGSCLGFRGLGFWVLLYNGYIGIL